MLPDGDSAPRVLSVRDIVVKALEGDFRSLQGGEFPEHCAGSVRCPADLAKLRWELVNSVHEKNARDAAEAVNCPLIGGAA